MVKRLLNIALAVAVFSSLAMAQERVDEVVVEGPDAAAAQAGPAAGSTQGPDAPEGIERRDVRVRVRRPMTAGGMMRFRGRGLGEWWTNPRVAEEIGLSDQQKQQLEKISQDGRLKMIDLRADLEKQEVILGPMLRAFHPDESQVLAQVEKVSQARAAVERERVQTMLASRGVLNEEQWNKLKDMRAESHRTFRRRSLPRPARPGTPPAAPAPPANQ